MACCGIVDVTIYISTRKSLVKSSVGMKGSKFTENENALRRFKSGEERQQEQSIRMNGLGRTNSDALPIGNRASVGKNFSKKGAGGFGDIVVSQTVVMDSEDSQDSRTGNTTPRRGGSRSDRSDSLRSLVGGKEDFAAHQKTWLA